MSALTTAAPAPRTRSSQRREKAREDLRERIVAAARHLFVEAGPRAVTMRAVADQLDYTAAALYAYFPDKDSLMQEVLQQGFSAFAQAFAGAARISDPVARFRAMGQAYVHFVVAHPEDYQVIASQFGHKEGGHKDSAQGSGPHAPGLLALKGLRDAVQGVLSHLHGVKPAPATLRLWTDTAWAGAHGLATLQVLRHETPARNPRAQQQAIDAMLDALIAGMRAARP